MKIKTVSLIGLGALGVMYAEKISQKLVPGQFRIIADKNRIQRYKNEGIYCNDKLCHFNYIEPNAIDIAPCDLLIVATKFTGLQQAIEDVCSQVGEQTIIISLLNGVSSEEYLAEKFGADKVVYCVAQGMDATKRANHLTYTASGLLCFGTDKAQNVDKVETLAAFFSEIGIAYVRPTNILQHLWSKFMFNVGVNQVVAVYGGHYKSVQKQGPERDMMIAAMNEVRLISEKNGINLSSKDINYWLEVLATLGAECDPSMRQDIDAKRPSEIELFSGTVIRLGKEYQVPTPINDKLYRSIKQLEQNY